MTPYFFQGGKFGHGFASSFISKYISEKIGLKDLIKGESSAVKTTRTLIAGVIGGTISEATGGKFANGAIQSAMQWACNAEGADGKECLTVQCYNEWQEKRNENRDSNAPGEYEGAWDIELQSKSESSNTVSGNDVNAEGGFINAIEKALMTVAPVVNKSLGNLSTPLLDEQAGPATAKGLGNIVLELRARESFGHNTPEYIEWRAIPYNDPRKQLYLREPEKCCSN